MTNRQHHTDDYSTYESDVMEVIPTLEDESIDFSGYSPPFAGLFNYSSLPNDFSNCKDKWEFLEQYDFLVREIHRVTKPGRITAVHCTDVISQATGMEGRWDFPHEIIKIHEKHGFRWRDRITIWKEPLKVRMRTMVRSLMHKLIVEDSTECFTAMPDYVLTFKKRGENKVPVTHSLGLHEYAGATPILPNILRAYNRDNETLYTEAELWKFLNEKFKGWKDPSTNKLSHFIWQRYASSIWDDIRIDNVLPFKQTKSEDDEKHVHPLQLDVIDRLIELYTNPGEVCLTPFAGVGTEVYSPVSMGRRAMGVELKAEYYTQMTRILPGAKNRFKQVKQSELF